MQRDFLELKVTSSNDSPQILSNSIYSDMKQRKAANIREWGAGANKCSAFLFDKWLKG